MCITPEKPLWLHGYADKARFRPFEGKLNDLFAKAIAVEDSRGERAVLIAADLCVLRAAEAKALFGRLTERTGLQRRQLLVNFWQFLEPEGPLAEDLPNRQTDPRRGAGGMRPYQEQHRSATIARGGGFGLCLRW